MDLELTNKLVSSELLRAEDIAAGLLQPGQQPSLRFSDTFRFSDYHEPLDRWPHISDPLLERIRKHGRQPPLLTDLGRTKGVPNQRQSLPVTPSDRIGSNLTPTAKHLKLKALRLERLRKARIRKLLSEQEQSVSMIKLQEKPKSTYKPTPYVKFNKLVSRPPLKPRTPMPGVYRKKIDFDTYQLPQDVKEEMLSSDAEMTSDVDEVDSVVMSTKDRRRASGQEMADFKLRSRITGLSDAGLRTSARMTGKKSFMEQFPYKSCQRGLGDAKKKQDLGKRKAFAELLYDRTAGEMPKGKKPLIPDERAEPEFYYGMSKAAFTALGSVKFKSKITA